MRCWGEKTTVVNEQIVENMYTSIVTPTDVNITDMRQLCKDLTLAISWQHFAHQYFNKSSSWFYNKFHARELDGRQCAFTPQGAEQMRGGLYDLAERIRRVADSI